MKSRLSLKFAFTFFFNVKIELTDRTDEIDGTDCSDKKQHSAAESSLYSNNGSKVKIKSHYATPHISSDLNTVREFPLRLGAVV